MIIYVLQKDANKVIKWGVFDNTTDCIKLIEYLLSSIRPQFIPSFIVVVGTAEGVKEYTLTDYKKEVAQC